MDKQRVLIADDEATIRYVFRKLLLKEGLEVTEAASGEEALELFEQAKPDLVMLDVMMPGISGFDVCATLKSNPDNHLTPVIIVTASSAIENRIRGLECGADDFVSKPVDRIELVARVRSLLRIKRYTDELESAETVICALARSIEGKDPYTEGHCERLSIYGETLGERLGLDDVHLVALRRAGIVHDVGKVCVPDAILLKKGKLTDDEYAVIKEHPIVGENICRDLKAFRHVLPIIRHHHERMDGSGYPDGLVGEAIPLPARILTVVDVFDALTTERPYKAAFSTEKALRIMQEEVDRGWWDPAVFEQFRKLVGEQGFSLAPPDGQVVGSA